MPEPSGDASDRRARLLVAAVVVLGLLVGTILLVSRLQGSTGPDAAGESPSPTASPRASEDGASEPPPTSSSPEQGATTSPDPTESASIPGPLPVTATAPVGETAQARPGVAVVVPSIKAMTAEGGGGIGDLAGPAMAVTVEVTNDTGTTLALSEIVVTAVHGTDRVPAPPNVNDPRNEWMTGPLAPGRSADGVYVFSLPGAGPGRDDVTIMVSIAGGEPFIAFSGSVR